MKEKLKELEEDFLAAIDGPISLDKLKEIKVKYLGKKGLITGVLRGMGKLDSSERPVVGKIANELREKIEKHLAQKEEELKKAAMYKNLAKEKIDVTLPGRKVNSGHKHPITIITDEIESIFMGMGFQVLEGPEVESEHYNFEALNIPREHPARDMQDSFYLSGDILLRTHTSPVQIRTMEKTAPKVPLRVIAPGRVYRRDDDATHSPMFHQVEGFVVDEKISLSDLKGTLLMFARKMFGEEQKIRLRPSFFPFTEPSAEVDIACVNCSGKGCRVCSDTGWLEILGAGMIHPKVFQMAGYDPEKVTGYAFGMGVERIAMLKYGINDLRLLYTNDMRMLRQFS